MTTEDALLAAIRETPDDDLPRLVYADWLEENGQPERAEFVRVQVEIWAVDRLRMMRKRVAGGAVKIRSRLAKRERELWNFGASGTWVDTIKPEFDCIQCIDYESVSRDNVRIPVLIYRRGFVAEVRCTLVWWYGGGCERCRGEGIHACDEVAEYIEVECPACSGTGRTPAIGPRLVREHPIEKVVLTDREPTREPLREGGNYRWNNGNSTGFSRDGLPWDVLRLLTGYCDSGMVWRSYPTRDSALDRLSQAALAWAKSQPVATPAPV